MPKIYKIDAKKTYLVRQSVLRKGKPIESCLFEGDELPTTKHFGYFIQDNLIGIISLFECSNPLFIEEKQFQIRGMAVLDSFQKKGIGEALILHTEQYLKKNNEDFVWFNARETAVGFYQKLDYSILGTPFMIEGVGIHIVMYKKIT